MRTCSIDCGKTLGCWLAASIAALVAAAPTFGEELPSLAQTISYEHAELWRNGGTSPASLTEAVYSTPASAMPIDDAAGEPCATCNGGAGGGGIGGYPYNRCGCSTGLWPWFTGPGACDDWCVGPHWEVAADGMIMFREGVNWAAIPAGAGFTNVLADQFNEAIGARLFVTGYNENRFGLQVGYEGVNDFHANALFTNGAGDSRAIGYESRINSVEINFVRRTDIAWRPFGGMRYIQLDDDFVDFTTVNKPIPVPADPPAAPAAFVDSGRSVLLNNRLFGFQAGAFRDVWRWNRWLTVEPFGNGGVYLNDFKRADVTRSVTTVITGDDLSTAGNEFTQTTTEVNTLTARDFSELAFVGEAGVTGVVRLSRCVALRGGYQILVVDGVGRGIDGFQAPGLNPTTLVYHGGTFGLEYVR